MRSIAADIKMPLKHKNISEAKKSLSGFGETVLFEAAAVVTESAAIFKGNFGYQLFLKFRNAFMQFPLTFFDAAHDPMHTKKK